MILLGREGANFFFSLVQVRMIMCKQLAEKRSAEKCDLISHRKNPPKMFLPKIAHRIIFRQKFYKTLNGRLPPEDGSVRPQTWGKRVSDDPRHLTFRRQKKIFGENFRQNFRGKF